MGKNLSNKYSQKLLDSPTKTGRGTLKFASKRAIQKTAEATGDLIGNRIANKITKKSSKDEITNELEKPKERYISPEERQQIIDELRLI